MQPLFAIPPGHNGRRRGPGEQCPAAEVRETKEAKAGRMQDMYKAPAAFAVAEKREKLARSVLPDLNKAEQKGKRPHPADTEILEWMRAERKRAEEHAEKRWRAKFQDMVRSPQSVEFEPTPIEFQSRGSTGLSATAPLGIARVESPSMMARSMSMMSLGGSRGSFAGTMSPAEGGLGRYQIEELQRLRVQAEEFKKSKKQMAIEQRIRAEIEHKLLLTAAELEETRARCDEAEKQLRVFKNMHAAQRLADIERLMEGIGAEGQMRSSSAGSQPPRSADNVSISRQSAAEEAATAPPGTPPEEARAAASAASPRTAGPSAAGREAFPEPPEPMDSVDPGSVAASPEKSAPTPSKPVAETPAASSDRQAPVSPDSELSASSPIASGATPAASTSLPVQQNEATGSSPTAASQQVEAVPSAKAPGVAAAKAEEAPLSPSAVEEDVARPMVQPTEQPDRQRDAGQVADASEEILDS